MPKWHTAIALEIAPIRKHIYDEAVMAYAYWLVFKQLFVQPQEQRS
jgi:hypothetical protein